MNQIKLTDIPKLKLKHCVIYEFRQGNLPQGDLIIATENCVFAIGGLKNPTFFLVLVSPCNGCISFVMYATM